MSFSEYKGVLVFVEQRQGEIQNVSLELLGKGREMADKLGDELIAVVLGQDVAKMSDELAHHGADQVIIVDDKDLAIYTTEPYAQALSSVIMEKKPDIVLVGATAIGRDLAPRVSARVSTGLTADCTSLEIDEERQLLMTRPAFGGNIMATIVCPDHRPQMSTVRPGVMQKLANDESRTAKVEDFKVDFNRDKFKIKVLEVVKEEKEKVNIEDADILVSGGRGIGSEENFAKLDDLAVVLEGTVSASRAVVDSGWVDHDRQVGQTGKTVRPNVYFALGISGAIQHVAGMEGSEFIVAINKDSTAAIFEHADVGIVGDVNKILPLLVEEIKTAKAKKYE